MVGQHFERFFHKLIWSPWQSFIIAGYPEDFVGRGALLRRSGTSHVGWRSLFVALRRRNFVPGHFRHPADRVTRWVCEKIAQKVTQSIFLCQMSRFLFPRKKSCSKFWATFVTFKEICPKYVGNGPIGENSPNLVTPSTDAFCPFWPSV
jgi:hypothetical protein